MFKRHPILSLLLAGVITAGGYYAWISRPIPDFGRSILLFTKTEGFRHDSIPKGIDTVVEIGRKAKFNVVQTEDATLFNDASLAQYQAVVFLNTTGDVLDEEQQVAFERYIQAGGGFAGIHSAADTEWDSGTVWPWYHRLVGGVFAGHPKDSNQSGDITVRDHNHPATAGLPARWSIVDEWYDYRRVSDGINVLMTVDESSYEGAEMGAGADHPVAWYRDFDGGRSFYTTMGHGDGTYENKNFIQLIEGGILYAIGDGTPLDYTQSRPEAWRFTRKVLDSNLNEPLKITFSPQGDLYFVERKGNLKRYDFAEQKSVVVHSFEDLYTFGEYGLLGLAFDPDFSSNHWVYFFRTVPDGDAGKHVLARFTLVDNVLDASSEQVLLSMPAEGNESKATSHTGGDMQFDAEGNLWLTTGDDTEADDASKIDDRPGFEFRDAGRSAGNSQDLRGKILRIKPRAQADESGRFYDIPEGNLFAAEEGRPEIYVMGLRNPYTIAYDNRKQRVYWGEVGPDAQDDNARGPRGYDEVNFAEAAGNFGWPYVIANNQPYAYFDYENAKALDVADVQAPENRSRNNTGLKVLPPAQPAWLYYPYKESDTFFELDSGGRNALVAPIYYSDEADPDSSIKFPGFYDGKVIISDFIRRWMMVVETDTQGQVESISPVINYPFSAPLDMAFGPDGALYVVEYGTDWFKGNVDSYISRIEYYAGENPPPVAVASASKTIGAVPLTTTLDGSASYDRGDSNAVLQYRWQLIEDGKPGTLIGEEQRQPFTLDKAGVHYVQLTVTDDAGNESSTRVNFQAGNERPEIQLAMEGNRTFFYKDQSVDYAVAVNDKEDGSSSSGALKAEDISVTFGYVQRGEDLAQALVQQTSDPILEGRQLVEGGSDCHACHGIDTASIGPAFQKVAERYAGRDDAADYLQKVIANGGSGQWGGTHAMPGHPNLSQSQLQHISTFILSLANGSGSSNGGRLALQGSLSFDRHADDYVDLVVGGRGISLDLGRMYTGRYIFNVSYTDRGTELADPLQGRETIILRSPLVPAADADEVVGMRGVGVGNGVKVMLVRAPSQVAPFSYVMFKGIDLSGIQRIKVLAAGLKPMMRGGVIELRLDEATSKPAASADVKAEFVPNMDENPVYLDVSGIDGVHDLYLGASKAEDEDGKTPYAIMGFEFLK